MRKLIILKSLIDFIWIITCIPSMLLLVFYAIYMFVEPGSLNLVFKQVVWWKELIQLKNNNVNEVLLVQGHIASNANFRNSLLNCSGAVSLVKKSSDLLPCFTLSF